MAFKNTRAGQLHERIGLQKRVSTSDGYGNEEASFDTQFECRAGFSLRQGNEAVIAARLTGVQPVVMRVRSTVAMRQVQPDWRIIDMNTEKIYAIRAIMQDFDDKHWMDIIAVEGVAP